MSQNDKVAVFPTRMSLANMNARLKAAQKGHDLLKKKVDALNYKFRQLLKKIIDAKSRLGELMRESYFALTEANFVMGDLSGTVQENVGSNANIQVSMNYDNIAGVKLPLFVAENIGESAFTLTGLGKGGKQVQTCKDRFSSLISLIVEIVSLQTSFITLDEVILSSNRRVNAIEYIIIPKYERTVEYIKSELDEGEREDFFRLKKIQNLKKREKLEKEEKRKITADSSQPELQELDMEIETQLSKLSMDDSDLLF